MPMASFRKKYSPHIEGPSKDAPVVASTPVTAASPPPVAEAPKNIEQPTETNPVDEAAKTALKQRLREMEQAETLVHQQTAPRAAEPRPPQPPIDAMEQAIAALPERAQRWCRAHPEFLTNPERAAQLQYCHWVAKREIGEEGTDAYFDRMEALLDISTQQQQQPKPGSNGHSAPAAPPRNSAPAALAARNGVPARQQYNGHVSAPPTRDVPSMASGKPTNRRPPLTENELQIAKNSGISPEEYQLQKEKMERLKAAGAIQNG
jgi:hypothetical protein